ncbi:hypothetical protein BS614_23990 [Paenibacillus xylanexedens]|uniref:hypothetical protein n=1 Tax=Paenibacillus xylanexedens TaxID=528191 RepID=UPI0009384E70|nr:hypothetical protein [Paenibacillus xylanexedens]APO46800.1 hypothetical protein BS614_23990 [Paenibacillus xylanexedens]
MEKKIVLPILLSFILVLSFGTSVFAANLGQSLKSPEAGWNRFDDDNTKFIYTGEWETSNSGSAAWYGGGVKYITKSSDNDSVRFNFQGTKLRVIAQTHISRTDKVQVKIDNEIIDTYSINNSASTDQSLIFEKVDLADSVHNVELINLNPQADFIFDAIDIDGELLDPTISTPNPEPQPAGDRAILTVSMTTGLEKEYDLPMSDVNTFLSWYDVRDTGTGPSKFAINKYSNNKGPFSKRTDYVIFDKILTFEVSEYTTK